MADPDVPAPGRRGAIVALLASLPGLALLQANVPGAKATSKRHRKRKRALHRCRQSPHNPPPGSGDGFCPQRACCACAGDNDPACIYVPADNPNPGMFCAEFCGPRSVHFVAVEDNVANFCTIDLTCAQIACPVT